MTLEENKEIIANLAMQITKRITHISSVFPKQDEKLLKHLAASAIHMAIFIQEFYAHLKIQEIIDPEKEIDKFLNECGCKDIFERLKNENI